ncbi:MAG TPA: lysogenization regulator HflD [Aeromonadales bacterium]|nr:lysogenization regulator HflD [Aeromonadales bacterium]
MPQQTNLNNQIIALAGCCQAAGMVHDLAHKGFAEHDLTKVAVNSILCLDPQSTEEIYGGVNNIRPGLKLLLEQLYPAGKRNMDIGRYVANLISLQSQLQKNKELVAILQSRLKQIAKQKALFNKDTYELTDSIAELYKDTLSSLPLKIQVTGRAKYLKQETVQKQVRTALMFGLRSAILWRQLGGKKRDFLFKRKAFSETINELELQSTSL